MVQQPSYHAFRVTLLWFCCSDMKFEWTLHTVNVFLQTEPPLNTPENREYLAEIMFESFNVPGLYIAVQVKAEWFLWFLNILGCLIVEGDPKGSCCETAVCSSFSAPSTHTHTHTHTLFGFELKCCLNMFCDLCFYCWYGAVQLLSFHIHEHLRYLGDRLETMVLFWLLSLLIIKKKRCYRICWKTEQNSLENKNPFGIWAPWACRS